MARLEDLISQIADAGLRASLLTEVADLKRRQQFGLVFEHHIPETSALRGFVVRDGGLVQLRTDATGAWIYCDDDGILVSPEPLSDRASGA
jgi:adenine-specific DNA-methyltransferase